MFMKTLLYNNFCSKTKYYNDSNTFLSFYNCIDLNLLFYNYIDLIFNNNSKIFFRWGKNFSIFNEIFIVINFRF